MFFYGIRERFHPLPDLRPCLTGTRYCHIASASLDNELLTLNQVDAFVKLFEI